MDEPAPTAASSKPSLSALVPGLVLPRASELDTTPDTLPTGLAPLDAMIGGLTLRSTHLLAGASGSGVTLLMHHLLAAATRDAPVLLLDPHARFHPPAATAAGVHLPHLLWARGIMPQHLRQALTAALDIAACPLIVWHAGQPPSPAVLDRLHASVHRGRAAVLIVTTAPVIGSLADGTTLIVQRRVWWGDARGRPGCGGNTLTVAVTDHRRGKAATLFLDLAFARPFPPLVNISGKRGKSGADTARRGHLATGSADAVRRAG